MINEIWPPKPPSAHEGDEKPEQRFDTFYFFLRQSTSRINAAVICDKQMFEGTRSVQRAGIKTGTSSAHTLPPRAGREMKHFLLGLVTFAER